MKKVALPCVLLFLFFQAFSQNPVMLKDVAPGNNSGTIQHIVKTGNYTFFNENDGGATTDRSLYRTDGTPAGTIKLNLTYPGFISTKADKLTALGNKVVFAGDNKQGYGEIWASDGSQAGTVALERFQPLNNRIPVVEIKTMASYTYYSVIDKSPVDNLNHAYLRKTDGTTTTLVYDFSAFAGVPQVLYLTPVNNILYFIVYDAEGTGVDQLWRSDGTTAGTSMVYNFTTAAFVESFIMPVGNTIYLMIGSQSAGERTNTLWKSDGTAPGTVPVKVIGTHPVPGPLNNVYPPFAAIDNTFYFAGVDVTYGKELWKTDGTDAGTVRLTDINPGAASANPLNLAVLNNSVYFSANNGTNGVELWKYDGTTASMVDDIFPGSGSSNPAFLVESNGSILFQATNGFSGNELWITDGSAGNTKIVADINLSGSSSPNLLTPGNPVYFAATNGISGFEVYKYDNSGSIQDIKTKLYVNDNSNSNDVFTTAVGSDNNPGTKDAPLATIAQAVSLAQEGATIYVDAGVFTEQVTIDKGITLVGAGSGVTIVLKPAVINTPPGSFNEPGTIQSAQNISDVHIRDMSVTGDNTGVTPIILQTGGSVKNCRLIGGNQGIFFRVNPAVKTVLIENNYLNVEYIGINCQGSGLSATLLNNTIELNNPGFSAGVFAGLDFGPLVKFTAIGNSINNFKSQGFLANSYTTNITQNSILGTGQYAIQQYVGVLSVATCNWYGTTNAGTIASKITGQVTYTPYLTNGTNTNTVYGNYSFVPVANSCSEGVSNFYVNDNNTTNDVFTTAVGSNANAGTRNAPFATLQYAISVAPANSVIHVDAGFYAAQVIIDRGIVINGAGKELTNFIKPTSTLVAAPGPFSEIGLIETTQGIGDVHIRNISINSVDGTSQNIIIQSGGSVKNCKLLNGGQGVFFRIPDASAKSAIVDGNIIEPRGIGVNCQGSGLSAIINNNSITRTAGYFAGIFAGLDFGPLPNLNIGNNIIHNYFGAGLEVNSNNGYYNNNSFVGTNGAVAIRKSSGNTPNATCNWYGSADQNIVIPQLSGAMTYTSWLTNGTDNDAVTGFQPVPNTCNGRQNKFYVNDNSQAGDVFTTTVGNDANSGIPSSPLLTINAALTKAQAGDTIFVDAGTYIESLIVNKQVVLRGAKFGQNPGALLDRGNETIIIPSVNNLNLTGGSVIRLAATDITIDGFTIDGNNTSIKSGVLVNGVDVNAATGIFNDDNVVSNITVKNNIVKNTGTYGIGMFRTFGNTTGPVVSGNVFAQNRVDNIGGRGILFAYSAYGSIINNYITRCGNSGVWFSQINVANVNNSPGIVSGNYIEAGNVGMQSSSLGINASAVYYQNNHIAGQSASALGLSLILANPSGIVVSNNKFTGLSTGIACNNSGNQNNMITVTINNNSFENISNLIFNILNNTYFNASCNWYGSAAAQGFINKLPLAANLDIVPWLTNGTDNDAGIGFQPVSNSCDGYPTLIVLDNYSHVTCNGANNGAINITSSYGKAPFTYTWTKDGDAGFISHDEDPSGLAPGTYRLAVTDGNGSNIYITDTEADGPGTIEVTITEPAVLEGTASGTIVDCNGNSTGTASVSATGGTAPYTYLWSNGATTASISNLVAGNYTATVTDANGCTAQANYTVTQPALLTANGSGTNVSCYGESNGMATVNVTGGTSPYSYDWSNGATTQSVSGLSIGTYSVTVTDGNGCTSTASYQVTQPALLTATATGTSTSCANSATVNATGGTLPYSYLWSNQATAQSISSLQAGTYSVTVTDAKGCVATASVTVTANEAFNPSASVTDVSCIGGNNGTITITNTNSTGPYTFSRDGVNFTAIPQALPFTYNGFTAGTYTIYVRDVNGCTGFVTKTIKQPAAIDISFVNVQNTCGNNGSITIAVSGGSPAYSYSWTSPTQNNFSTQANISGLIADTYTLEVTDKNGCKAQKTQEIINVGINYVFYTPTDVTCKGEANGAISLSTVAGGSGNYSFLWSNGATTRDISNLVAGTYTVVITDNITGCTRNKVCIVSQPAGSLLLNVSKTNVSGCLTPGTITAIGSGGNGGYTYKLNNGAYQSSGNFTGLSAGDYTVTVKDVKGCTKASAILTITDNGTDEYESLLNAPNANNNNKSKAAPISIGSTVSARIGVAGDEDWYKFTTPAGYAGYTVSFTNPPAALAFTLYPAGSNTAVPVASGTTTAKSYNLLGNTTYNLTVSGTNSLICYQLLVAPLAPLTVTPGNNSRIGTSEILSGNGLFKISAYPNPSNSSFTLKLESNGHEMIRLRVLDATGRLIEERQNLSPGETLQLGDRYINGVYMAEIIQGINRKTVKLIKQ
jgi:ELWxxDGT repeat protein